MTHQAAFLLADPLFFELPEHIDDAASRFTLADASPPSGWRRRTSGIWISWWPSSAPPASQGWKIHVSASDSEAEEMLEVVRSECVHQDVPFKFLRSRLMVTVLNEKYADRASAGKFATIYPANDDGLCGLLDCLDERLAGRPAPYILSDLRWRNGPLHVRYGAFLERYCVNDAGDRVPALTRPDGVEVPDKRIPAFSVPEWVTVPALIANQPRGTESLADFPYTVEEALHFSNGGGIYLATDPSTSARVILREARPHAGRDGRGDDAVSRLHRSCVALHQLRDVTSVPKLVRRFTAWEHEFAAEEYVEGETLQHSMAARHPLIYPDASPEKIADYVSWAVDIVEQIEESLREIHGRGLVMGDLHPANVLVRPDGRIAVIDFEQSHRIGEDFDATLGAVGFASRRFRSGVAIDDYALGCLRLAVLMPLTPLLNLDKGALPQLISAASRMLPPPGYIERTLELLGERPFRTERGPADGLAARPPTYVSLGSLAEAIVSTADKTGRPDRLFPGDLAQFSYGPGTLAFGAGGVLAALAATGNASYDAFADHLDWLARAASDDASQTPGLLSGLHGTAYALALLGHPEALSTLNRARSLERHLRTVSLWNGRAGAALALARLDRLFPGQGLLDQADQEAHRLWTSLVDPAALDVCEPDEPGLLYGWSGPAYLWATMHELTGDRRHLKAARIALWRDLSRCEPSPGDGLQVKTGRLFLLYLATGSAGIAVAAQRLFEQCGDERLALVTEKVINALGAEAVMYPGLFHGRAGLLAVAAHLAKRTGSVKAARISRMHLRLLDQHRLQLNGLPIFPGDGLLKLSTDLATGSAGVLMAAHAALRRTGVVLPMIGDEVLAAPATDKPFGLLVEGG